MDFIALRELFFQEKWFVSPKVLEAYKPLLSASFSSEMTKPKPQATKPVLQVPFRPGAMPGSEPEGKEITVARVFGLMTPDIWYMGTPTREVGQLLTEAIHGGTTAIVLHLNSGGGTASSVAHIKQPLALAKEKGIPTVAFVEFAASAAYWVASMCDYVYAFDPMAEVGSIGTMAQFYDSRKYWEDMGIKEHNVYPPESANKNEEVRMALDGDYSLLINQTLTPLAESFQNAVRAGRGDKLNESMEGLLTGREFFARDVVPSLVDGFGTLQDAMQTAMDRAAIQAL